MLPHPFDPPIASAQQRLWVSGDRTFESQVQLVDEGAAGPLVSIRRVGATMNGEAS